MRVCRSRARAVAAVVAGAAGAVLATTPAFAAPAFVPSAHLSPASDSPASDSPASDSPALTGDGSAAGPGAGPAHVVVDPAHRHVFVSGGRACGDVEVFGTDGRRVATVADQAGADGMALSLDGRTLYVALSRAGAVSAVDTTTLRETARYTVGTGVEPLSLVPAGGRLWFSYRAPGQGPFDGGIGAVNPGGGVPAVTLGGTGWQDAPLLAADPADPGTLVAADAVARPATVEVLNVSSGTAVVTSARQNAVPSAAGGLAVTPDGHGVLVSGSGTVRLLRLPGLTPAASRRLPGAPGALAVAPDGTIAAADGSGRSATVRVLGPGGGTAPLRRFRAAAGTAVAWAPDRSALYTATGGRHPALTVRESPEQADNSLTPHAPSGAAPGSQYTVSGLMTALTPFADGQTVQVTRTDPADPDGTELPDAAVTSTGTFSFTDTATAPGEVVYQISYAGDPLHQPAQTTATLRIRTG